MGFLARADELAEGVPLVSAGPRDAEKRGTKTNGVFKGEADDDFEGESDDFEGVAFFNGDFLVVDFDAFDGAALPLPLPRPVDAEPRVFIFFSKSKVF